MPYKDRSKRLAYAKAYNKKHYEENPEYHKAKAKRSRQNVTDWFKDFKSKLSCKVCGEDDPVVLDFHHRDKTTKEFSISDGLRRYSRQRMLDEIDKCDVMCANCHRRHHHDRL